MSNHTKAGRRRSMRAKDARTWSPMLRVTAPSPVVAAERMSFMEALRAMASRTVFVGVDPPLRMVAMHGHPSGRSVRELVTVRRR